MDRTQVAVVGGGLAGTSAAIQAAEADLDVTLVDENPIDFSMMGLDVPFLFGQRMMPTLRDKGLMLQRVVSSSDLLATAQEIGVQALLGTYVWGSFRNEENSRQLERPVLGLADEDRSWLLEYDHLILAPGARDLVLGFPGQSLAGVMGANGASLLLSRYQALTAEKMVVLGSGALGLSSASQAIDNGIEVVAVVDISPTVRGDEGFRANLKDRGVLFYTSHTIKEARGYREVESIVISQVNGNLQPIDGSERELQCDTVCLAMGLVPSIELPYLTGCNLSYRPELGGYIPDIDQHMRTSIENVYVVGDGGGFYEGMVASPEVAANQGKLAGITVAETAGALDKGKATSLRQEFSSPLKAADGESTAEYWAAWLSSLISTGGMNVNACECEEVTRTELLNVAPPRHLSWPSEQMSHRNLTDLLEQGAADLDRLKRLTRTGMGYCQGRRCREETALLVAQAAGIDLSQIPLASYRPPVRPLPLKIMWPHEEPEELRRTWDYWVNPPMDKVKEVQEHQGRS
ncbi:MAG: FAD-dependent oxidoreductase [Dehalococcoidia bacterium]